jgi:catechol 2,3-dioxygenase-like lactoylglutathione lyase family enzyme
MLAKVMEISTPGEEDRPHPNPTEVKMSSTDAKTEVPTEMPEPGTIDMKLEVINLPVSDVDRAKRFYQKLGWRLDGDFAVGEDFRAVQLTPSGSQCSITFGKGVTTAAPGSVQDLMLIVHDIGTSRDDLISRGVEVSEIYHYEGRPFHSAGTEARVPGPDPDGRSYFTWASFSDPDGNGWLLQEIKTRLPGREWT